MTTPDTPSLWRRLRPVLRWVAALLPVPVAVLAAAAARQSFDLPADTAERAIRRLSEQSGVEVLFPTNFARDLRTKAVRGEFTPREALDRLLAGTGLVSAQDEKTGALTVRREGADPNALRAAPPGTRSDRPEPSPSPRPEPAPGATPAADETVQLSPFRVDTTRDRGYYASTSVTGTRLNVPIKDLPMSLEVVTKEFIEDIGAVDFKEALNYSAGVVQDSVQASNNFLFSPSGTGQATGALSRDSVALNLRGYNTRFVLRNGFRSDNVTDIANVDRQEIMRGPAALLYGVSALGGIVNLLPRYPRAEPRYDVRVGFGSNEFQRAEVNATGPVWKRGAGGGRLNYNLGLIYQKLSDYTDFDDRERVLVLPSLDWQPFAHTRIFVDIEAGRLRSTGNGFKDVADNNPANVRNALGLAVSNRNEYNEDVQVARDVYGRDRRFRWSGEDVFARTRYRNFTATVEQRIREGFNVTAGVNLTGTALTRRYLDSQGTLLAQQAAAPTTPGVWFNTGPNPLAPAQNLWKTINYQWGSGGVDKDTVQTRLDATYTLRRWGEHTLVLGRQDTQVEQTSLATAQVTTNLGGDGNRSYVAHNDLAYLRYQGERIRPFRDTYFKEWNTGHYAVYMAKFWRDRLTAVAGYRWDRYMTRQLDYTYTKASAALPDSNVGNWVRPAAYDASANSAPGAVPVVEGYRFGGRVQREESPTAGLNVALTRHLNLYVMHATGVFPNTGQRDGAGNPFEAERTTGGEIGLKAELMKDAAERPRLSVSLGVYRIKRDNAIYNVFWAPQPRSNDRQRTRGFATAPVSGTGPGAYSVTNSGFQDFETRQPVTYLLPLSYVAPADLGHPRVTGAPQQNNLLLVDYASLGPAAADPLRRAMDAAANDSGNLTALQTGATGSGATGLYANNGYAFNRNSDVSYSDQSQGFDTEIVFSPTDSYSLRLTYAYTLQGVTGGFRIVDQARSTEYDSWWNYMGVPLEQRRNNLDEASYDFVGLIKGVRLIDNPRNSASLWHKYTFRAGRLRGADVGLGVNWNGERQSEILITNGLRNNAGAENVRMRPRYPAHYTLNAGVGYRTRLAGRAVNFRLNVNNLLNDQKDIVHGSSTLFINPATGTTVASTTAGAQRITVPERAQTYFAPISFRLTAGTQF